MQKRNSELVQLLAPEFHQKFEDGRIQSNYLAVRPADITLVNGANHNIDPGNASILRVAGVTGPFSITGIAGGVYGRVLIIYTLEREVMTISNSHASSLEANRILTATGLDVVVGERGRAFLVYAGDPTGPRWILISHDGT